MSQRHLNSSRAGIATSVRLVIGACAVIAIISLTVAVVSFTHHGTGDTSSVAAVLRTALPASTDTPPAATALSGPFTVLPDVGSIPDAATFRDEPSGWYCANVRTAGSPCGFAPAL